MCSGGGDDNVFTVRLFHRITMSEFDIPEYFTESEKELILSLKDMYPVLAKKITDTFINSYEVDKWILQIYDQLVIMQDAIIKRCTKRKKLRPAGAPLARRGIKRPMQVRQARQITSTSRGTTALADSTNASSSSSTTDFSSNGED